MTQGPRARAARPARPAQGASASPDDSAFDRDALRLAEESAGVGVWSIDLTTGRVRGTEQFFRIMGLETTTREVPVEQVRAVRHRDDRERVLAGFRSVLEGRTDAYEIEYRIVRPDGELRWIYGRGRVVRDANGKAVRYSGVDLDITERKAAQAELAAAKAALERMNRELEHRVAQRTAELESEARRRAVAEERLHQAQKMEAVGQLTGGVAHDFNNILQVVLGNLEIAAMVLRRESEVDARQGAARARLLEAIETAQRASRSAQQLVHRLLTFSRQQTLEATSIDVNALVADMGDMIQRTLGETIHMQTVLARDAWSTFADRNHLETALLNLVVNARDAMARGGRLIIETANTTVGEGYPDDLAVGDYVMLCVSDTGCGMAPEVLQKAFDPFFTTKDVGKGSGLGLSMVYGFVKQSGGHVRIYSEPGEGTSVRLYLPRARHEGDAPAASSAVASETVIKARNGETVLLVEDNAEVRRFGVAALESLGYRVLHATDAHAALHLLQSESPAIDVLFTDVVLPGGMSGADLADRVRSQRSGIAVLYTSGYTPQSAVQHARLLSTAGVLSKPYSIPMLGSAIRKALDARKRNDGDDAQP